MPAQTDERTGAIPAIIVGVSIMIGLSSLGYLVGRGALRFRSGNRVVTVKGLVERELKADQAVWILHLRRASETVQDAHARISADRDATVAFLLKQGFRDTELERQPTRTIDKLAREYIARNESDRLRYVVTTSVKVRTSNVDLIRAAVSSTEELLKSGVLLDGQREGGANPRYIVSRFNDLRPQLLADATRNARATAQQFAADSGAQVGGIRSANQGSIQIFGEDGGDESAPFSATSSLVKRIRVVSTFEFELR